MVRQCAACRRIPVRGFLAGLTKKGIKIDVLERVRQAESDMPVAEVATPSIAPRPGSAGRLSHQSEL